MSSYYGDRMRVLFVAQPRTPEFAPEASIATSVQICFEPDELHDQRRFEEAIMRQLMPELTGYVLHECWLALREKE